MGPVVSSQQFERVNGYIAGAKADPNCRLVAGGGRPAAAAGQPGFFIEPTIFEVTGNDAKIWKEEIFGPVLSVRTFKVSANCLLFLVCFT
jgi:acyl-CoA reductase-like NAD-dependent aldehyde dehydrogenase